MQLHKGTEIILLIKERFSGIYTGIAHAMVVTLEYHPFCFSNNIWFNDWRARLELLTISDALCDLRQITTCSKIYFIHFMKDLNMISVP